MTMKLTNAHSFPDADVVAWRLSDALLEVEVSDVFFDGDERCHGHAKMTFPLVQPVSARSYDHNSKQWIEETVIEPLKDICVFHCKMEQHYSLEGFGTKSGKWLAVSVVSNEAEITW